VAQITRFAISAVANNLNLPPRRSLIHVRVENPVSRSKQTLAMQPIDTLSLSFRIEILAAEIARSRRGGVSMLFEN